MGYPKQSTSQIFFWPQESGNPPTNSGTRIPANITIAAFDPFKTIIPQSVYDAMVTDGTGNPHTDRKYWYQPAPTSIQLVLSDQQKAYLKARHEPSLVIWESNGQGGTVGWPKYTNAMDIINDIWQLYSRLVYIDISPDAYQVGQTANSYLHPVTSDRDSCIAAIIQSIPPFDPNQWYSGSLCQHYTRCELASDGTWRGGLVGEPNPSGTLATCGVMIQDEFNGSVNSNARFHSLLNVVDSTKIAVQMKVTGVAMPSMANSAGQWSGPAPESITINFQGHSFTVDPVTWNDWHNEAPPQVVTGVVPLYVTQTGGLFVVDPGGWPANENDYGAVDYLAGGGCWNECTVQFKFNNSDGYNRVCMMAAINWEAYVAAGVFNNNPGPYTSGGYQSNIDIVS